jgi:hypothetical protein
MPNPQRRSPLTPPQRQRAKRETSFNIIKEITGTLLAAAIFSASILTSVLGMSGGFDHGAAVVVAEVIDAR